MLVRTNKQVRKAALLVEMAAVVIVFTMLLFGILEYCRFIFIQQLIINAGREGCRYAVTRTLDDDVVEKTKERVLSMMGGMDQKLGDFDVQVYAADNSGNDVGSITDAAFGEYLAVEIQCDYDPIVPGLLRMNNTFHLKSRTMMYSEAN